MPKPIPLYLGADHAGFALKEAIKADLWTRGYDPVDVSPNLVAGDDYPLAARKVAMAVQKDQAAFGLLFCGTGHGMDVAANRFRGVRAVVARSERDAKLSREHNHANVLVLGGWVTKPAAAKKIVATFLKTKPSKTARHVRRVKQLDQMTDNR
ncbi:RpiB/LacA/LacB family sugar-phosphate isomerase [Candidatus Uhrbacteria bacterium]|nr:MAG: RpiB/LacA/LacB family sugar-phosphate isomerase [Candidatus Uhrbacteria bacterium]